MFCLQKEVSQNDKCNAIEEAENAKVELKLHFNALHYPPPPPPPPPPQKKKKTST